MPISGSAAATKKKAPSKKEGYSEFLGTPLTAQVSKDELDALLTLANKAQSASLLPLPYENSLEVGQAVATVSKELNKQQISSTQEIVSPALFNVKKTGCTISVGGGRTINLGDYNSARFDVHLTLPCDPENLDAAYNWAAEWVDNRIQEETKEATGGV